MFANLLVLLIVLAITVFFDWLTIRAVKKPSGCESRFSVGLAWDCDAHLCRVLVCPLCIFLPRPTGKSNLRRSALAATIS
ncbi:MAG: hypothetical protein LDL51_06490 [Chloroflexi bacterium]|nr:hypothetical protein [Chloroflexota bacterium]